MQILRGVLEWMESLKASIDTKVVNSRRMLYEGEYTQLILVHMIFMSNM